MPLGDASFLHKITVFSINRVRKQKICPQTLNFTWPLRSKWCEQTSYLKSLHPDRLRRSGLVFFRALLCRRGQVSALLKFNSQLLLPALLKSVTEPLNTSPCRARSESAPEPDCAVAIRVLRLLKTPDLGRICNCPGVERGSWSSSQGKDHAMICPGLAPWMGKKEAQDDRGREHVCLQAGTAPEPEVFSQVSCFGKRADLAGVL